MDSSTPSSPLPDDIHAITKKKLYRYARAMNIRRRACMNKKELWQAVTGTGNGIKFFNSNSPCVKKSQPTKKSPSPSQSYMPSNKITQSSPHNSPINKPSVKFMEMTNKTPISNFTIDSAPVTNVTKISLKPFDRLKYKSIILHLALDDIKRAIRKRLLLTLDYNITLRFLYYNENLDVFGTEVQVTKEANATFYWTVFKLSKNIDGYKDVTVVNSTKGLTTPPKDFVLIF